jgi:hypothetical protein
MCRRTSSFTELGTCANEDAFDKYDTASANAGEGEYGAIIPIVELGRFKGCHISRRIYSIM